MLIRPGANQPATLNLVEVVKKSSKRRIQVTIQDNYENPVDIEETVFPSGESSGELDLELVDRNDNIVLSSQYWPTPNPPDNRITKVSTGKYYITLSASETASAGTLLANWHARSSETSEDLYRVQVVEVVSSRVLAILPKFRLLLDKTLKIVNPEENCFLGYTDSMLIMFLQMGLSKINSYQPYPTFSLLENYPLDTFSETLLRASLFEALTSQFLFSIDNDILSYNEAGSSFVLDHRTPLGNYLNSLSNQLDKEIPQLKLHFVSSGTVGLEYKFGNYYYSLLSGSPYGALLRGGLPNTNV